MCSDLDHFAGTHTQEGFNSYNGSFQTVTKNTVTEITEEEMRTIQSPMESSKLRRLPRMAELLQFYSKIKR